MVVRQMATKRLRGKRLRGILRTTRRMQRRCSIEKELEKLAEKLTGRKCLFERMICNEPKNVEFIDARISICKGKREVFAYAVVENPEFWASP
jgi:hypothetical protein